MQPQFTLAGPLLALFLLLIGSTFFRRYTGLPQPNAFFALLGSCIAAGFVVFSRMPRRNSFFHQDPDTVVPAALAAGACIVFLTAFALRLWGRWIGDKATPSELLPGKEGVRAWFSAGNVAIAVAIVVTAWFGYDVSPLLTAIVISGLLAAYPLLRAETTTVSTPSIQPPVDTHSSEREKILAMLEAGKLTPDESAELLQALSDRPRTPAPAVPLTGGQRLMLIGAALVLLGFFLPWFSVNPGKELGRVMNQLEASMTSSMPSSFPHAHGGPNISLPGLGASSGNITQSGGEVGRGLGWAALLLAIAAAILPYVATSLDTGTMRTIRFLCLGLGGLIVLYLITQNLRIVSIGLVLALGGYVLEIAGALREKTATPA